jgi:hypothetical protein
MRLARPCANPDIDSSRRLLLGRRSIQIIASKRHVAEEVKRIRLANTRTRAKLDRDIPRRVQLGLRTIEIIAVKDTEPVSPSVAIPLLRAAYDESRPELQDLWARLIAAVMDPKRSDGMRLSFIDSVKRFDPLDALVLKAIYDRRGEQSRPVIASLANQLNRSPAEVELSIHNLGALNCLFDEGGRRFQVSTYGSELMRICSG